MKKILLFLLVAIVVVPGCLVSELDEYRLTLNEDGKSGRLVVTKRNIQSDAKDPEQQEKDFSELIANWKSDDYLLTQMDRGTYVKDRQLRMEKGKLVWRETLLFSDIAKLSSDLDPADTVRISFDSSGHTVVKTNGTVLHDSAHTVVVWLPGERIFELTIRAKNFAPSSAFATRFRSYAKRRY